MRKLKRIVAIAMSMVMLLNVNGLNVYATQNITTENQTTQESTQTEDVTGKFVTEKVEEEKITEEVATEDITDLVDTQSEDVSTVEPLINSIVVAKNVVEGNESQYILVDMGEDSNKITDASITVVNKKTGKTITQSFMDIVESVFIFELTSNQLTSGGEYEVASLQLTSEGKEYEILLSETGIEAKFGVNVEIDTDADLILTDEEIQQDSEDGIIVTDSEGTPLSAEDISEALSDEDSSLLGRRSNGDLVVVLDPGHGGSDSGTCHNGVIEKNANLKIAQYCKEELEKYIDVEVYMTRNSDVYVGLDERTAYAASVGADIFVSIHNNYSGSSSARGSEVYYPNASYNSAAYTTGQGLASAILNALGSIGLPKRGIYTRDHAPYAGASKYDYYPDGSVSDYYSVIRTSKQHGFPGLIVEHAFASNVSDAAMLTSEAYLKSMGVADATAIAGYFGLSDIDGTKYRGIDYSPVYDFNYYIEHNQDVKAAYGNDPAGAFRHFVKYGMAEGRQASAEFNLKNYMNRYLDLRNEYGDDYKEYYRHYCTSGKTENRDAKTSSKRIGKVTCYKGVDYSAVYDFDYYIAQYPDVKKLAGDDDVKAIAHFVNSGMAEGRKGNAAFNVYSYANRYADLQSSYGSNLQEYYLHYITMGKAENRDGSGNDTKLKFTTPDSIYIDPDTVPDNTDAMLRMYNPNSGEHFYTKDLNEGNYLKSLGWNYEGVAWYAPRTGQPVYRLYNPNAGDHHYTTDSNEKDYLVKAGWSYEGISWYSGGNVPLYRAYNKNAKAGSHHYTVDKNEIDYIVKAGWSYEGTAWYGVK